jgi:hypothetical protein
MKATAQVQGRIGVPLRNRVEIGQQYRTVRTAYGTAPTSWLVVALFLPWVGGAEHVRLESLDGRGETMTLAATAVLDKNRFTLID